MPNFNINSEHFILRRKKIYVEIPVFLIYFAFTFSDSVTANFIKHRTCNVILGFKETDCIRLGENSSNRIISQLDRKVQPSAVVIISTLSIIQSLIPPLLCFFIGPWSNQYGRKPIMLYSTFALILQYSTMLFISSIPHMSPWYILLSQLLLCASGGVPALVGVIFSYIEDTIPECDRGIRIAFLEAMRSCGILLGISTAMVTLQSTSYVAVYSMSVVILILAWVFVWFYVPESVQVTQSENKLHTFFDSVSLVKTAKTTFKARDGYNRATLVTLIAIVIFYIIATSGCSSILSGYFQNHFRWNLTASNNYNTVISITTIVGGIICVYVLHVKLYCGELIGVVSGLLSLLSGSFVLAMASTTSIIHLGGCLQCFGPAVLSMAKSLMTKLVPHEEVSTVFAVVASLETVFALVGASIFAVIYNSTASTNPTVFLFVMTGLYLCQLILVSALLFIQRYWNPLTFRPIEDEEY